MSDTPLLDDATLTALRDVLRAGLVIDGVGVGGASWVVETTTGNGESTARTVSDGATITAYLYQQRVGRTGMAPAAPGAAVGDAVWYLAVVSGSVAVGQVVRSVGDGRRVRLGARVPDPLYPTYLAEGL